MSTCQDYVKIMSRLCRNHVEIMSKLCRRVKIMLKLCRNYVKTRISDFLTCHFSRVKLLKKVSFLHRTRKAAAAAAAGAAMPYGIATWPCHMALPYLSIWTRPNIAKNRKSCQNEPHKHIFGF